MYLSTTFVQIGDGNILLGGFISRHIRHARHHSPGPRPISCKRGDILWDRHSAGDPLSWIQARRASRMCQNSFDGSPIPVPFPCYPLFPSCHAMPCIPSLIYFPKIVKLILQALKRTNRVTTTPQTGDALPRTLWALAGTRS